MVRRGPWGSWSQRAPAIPQGECMTSNMWGDTVFWAKKAILGPARGMGLIGGWVFPPLPPLL